MQRCQGVVHLYHAADQLTIPTEVCLMQSTEPQADPSRTDPSLHRTDVCTPLAALPKGTSGKSRTRVRDHDAKMHVCWNQPRARFGTVEPCGEVMTLCRGSGFREESSSGGFRLGHTGTGAARTRLHFTYDVLKGRKVHVQQHDDVRGKLAASYLGSQIPWPWNCDAEVGS